MKYFILAKFITEGSKCKRKIRTRTVKGKTIQEE